MTFDDRRALALAILNKGEGLTRKSGQFLGQLCADGFPLTDKQHDWLVKLTERAGIALPKGLQHDE